MLNNMKRMIITSLLILLPIPVGLILRGRFPVELQGSPFFLIWLPSLSFLAGHWFCAAITYLDPGHEGRNKKVLAMVLWLMPLISWFCSGLMYALYLGLEFSEVSWTLALMGVIFTVMGNYMPKTRMNSTVGVKVPWAYTSEENWNATHRFAGKLWVAGGILMLLGVFLPEGAAIVWMFFGIFALTVVPTVYSWRYWKKQKAAGADLKPFPRAETAVTKAALIFLAVTLVFVLAILFTGDLEYAFGDDHLVVHADWYSDLTVRYEAIESIEFREGNVPGSRVGGFGSLRLLMGYFKNEEFGTHTRYTYYEPEACVILKTPSWNIVLSGKTAQETREIYDLLLEKSGS